MSLVLLVLAVLAVVFGFLKLIGGAVLFGLLLIAVGLLLGGYGRNGLR